MPNCRECRNWDTCVLLDDTTPFYGRDIAADNVDELCKGFIATDPIEDRIIIIKKLHRKLTNEIVNTPNDFDKDQSYECSVHFLNGSAHRQQKILDILDSTVADMIKEIESSQRGVQHLEEIIKALNTATFGVNNHILADYIKKPETIKEIAMHLYKAGCRVSAEPEVK